MRLALVTVVLLSAVALHSATSDESLQSEIDNQPIKRSPYLLPSSYFRASDFLNPISPAVPARQRDPRFLFALTWTTVTTYSTTSTTTSTITCTLSTSSTCTGRRRRFIEWPEEEEIAPSAVVKVETTPEADLESVRQSREANPQYFFSSPYSGPNYYQPNYAVQPTFESSFGYNYPSPASYYFGGYNPFAGYQYLHRQQPAVGDVAAAGHSAGFRFFFSVTTLTLTKTTTIPTYTAFTQTTSTSTPTCSTAGTLAQCPTG